MKFLLFKSFFRLLALSAFALSLAAVKAPAQSLIYGLTSLGTLVTFNEAGTMFSGPTVLLGAGLGETVVAIDFRPLDGRLYALTRTLLNEGRLYTVDLPSGMLTPVTLTGPAINLTGSVDIDFNPAAASGTNALRIVTGDEQNYRIAFNTTPPTVNVDGALNVTGGATDTNVIATAYSNNRAGLPGGGPGGTAQYAIDSATDLLYRVNPPNAGVLTNGLPLGIDVGDTGGLDITTDGDRALAVFTVGGSNGLYSVNLTNGATVFLAELSALVVDLAVPIPSAFVRGRASIYGLTSQNTLVAFDDTGDLVSTPTLLLGAGLGESAVAIDFRPFDSLLYVLTRDAANQGRLYTAEVTLGLLTAVPLAGATLTLTGSVGMDFNPAANGGTNALRIVTSEEQNYRIVFTTSPPTVNVDSALNVAGGATGTNVIATAYSNNRNGLPGGDGTGGTAQYAIDSATDLLYRVNPPNAGVLTNGLPLGIDVGSVGGLDITTRRNRALAVLAVGDTNGLYQIELTNGVATLLRSLPATVVDLAVPIPLTILRIVKNTDTTVEITWYGGVGPFAVQRSSEVTGPYQTATVTFTRSATLPLIADTGFFIIADRAGVALP